MFITNSFIPNMEKHEDSWECWLWYLVSKYLKYFRTCFPQPGYRQQLHHYCLLPKFQVSKSFGKSTMNIVFGHLHTYIIWQRRLT